MNNYITLENQDEWIDLYLTGRLDILELAVVEEKIKSDSIFQEQITFKRALMLGIRDEKKQQLKNMFAQLDTTPKIISMFNKNLIFKYAIAATVFLFIFISVKYFVFPSQMTEGIGKKAHISGL